MGAFGSVGAKLDQSVKLSPAETRLGHYRQCARDALDRANDSKNEELRAGLIVMAAGWQQMAEETERAITREAHPRVDALLPEKRT